MVFNSLHFLVFFLIVLSAYHLLSHRRQNWLLLVASYYFYAAWDWRFLGLLIASTLIDYACALAIDRAEDPRRRKLLLTLSLGFNLSMLGFFKYFNFFAGSLHGLFALAGWQLDFFTLKVLLPIGISFYTFMTMSYVIDVYRREITPTRNLLDFAVFIAFFPHLVAGPILRATKLLPQIVWLDTWLQRLTRGKVTLLRLAGLPNITLTVVGRKSGIPRTTPLLCVPHEGSWLIAGSNFGGAKPPLWVNNLRAAGTADVLVDGQRFPVTAREVEGEERARLWQVMLRTWPNYAKYEERTERTIPVFRLVR